MHGPSPHLKFWGTIPPVHLGLRPWGKEMVGDGRGTRRGRKEEVWKYED